MLPELPAEIIYNIALHLPTVSCLTNLAQTCQHLHLLIAAEDSRIFRAFLKTRFPYVHIPPFSKDASRALTSRSRALDKRAVIGRFVVPPRDAIKVGSHRATRADTPTLGYRPAIDSYEVWNGDLWSDRKEVLAWGGADELIIRIRQTGSQPSDKWVVLNDLDHVSSYDDICGVQLLKADHHCQSESDKEHLIFARVRGELVHVSIDSDDATHEYEQEFVTHGLDLERIDLSDGPEPILAAHFENGSIAFYHTTTGEAQVHPFARLQDGYEGVSRNQYSKFLAPNRLAVSTGCLPNSLSISTITPDHVSLYREIGVHSLDIEERVGFNRKANANVSAVAPLTAQAAGGSSGDVFLAAWGDRAVRYVCTIFNRSQGFKDTANIPLPDFMIYAPEDHTKPHIETQQTIIPFTASTPLATTASWSAQEATQYSNSSTFACTTPTAISTADSHHSRTPATKHPPPPPLRKTHPRTQT